MKNLVFSESLHADLVKNFQARIISINEFGGWRIRSDKKDCVVVVNEKNEVTCLGVTSPNGWTDFIQITGPEKARFDIEGMHGRYENGIESAYAHGHEEGNSHDQQMAWTDWILGKLKPLEARRKL